jgi:hypothetical protein
VSDTAVTDDPFTRLARAHTARPARSRRRAVREHVDGAQQ